MHPVAIAEIAGRDSVAAAVTAVREHGFRTLLPTVGVTGTETGDPSAPTRAVEALRAILGDDCEVLALVRVSDPELWTAMNARFGHVLLQRFGMWSPCLACHLYLHVLRVPVAWAHGNAPVIAGERDTHDGRLKLSQLAEGIDASVRVMRYADVDLLQPVRHASDSEIAHVLGDHRHLGLQLDCVLAGNYLGLDGSVSYDPGAYSRYVREYLEPIGRAVIDAWRAEIAVGSTPEWASVIASVLRARG